MSHYNCLRFSTGMRVCLSRWSLLCITFSLLASTCRSPSYAGVEIDNLIVRWTQNDGWVQKKNVRCGDGVHGWFGKWYKDAKTADIKACKALCEKDNQCTAIDISHDKNGYCNLFKKDMCVRFGGSKQYDAYIRPERPLHSCSDVPSKASGMFTIAGAKTMCDNDKRKDGGGWALVASFVNTDGKVHWSGVKQGYTVWRDGSTFGDAASAEKADFKSELFSNLIGSDLMISDAYGWVVYRGVLSDGNGRGSVKDLMNRFNKCQISALVKPGASSVKASNAIWQKHAMLALYAGDPNSGNGCAFSKRHTDSTMIAIGGMGCGTIGAGQVGSNYVKHHTGFDWHASLKAESTCACCDSCGKWHGLCAATSKDHANNKGRHDASTWGKLWVRT